MQVIKDDYRGWKVIINHHPGYSDVWMGYKVNDKGIATDVAEASTREGLERKIDIMEGM